MEINKLGRKSEKIKHLKAIFKNEISDEIATDDINIIKLMVENTIKINDFFICEDLEFKEETANLINKVKKLAQNCFLISLELFKSLSLKDNSIGVIATTSLKFYALDDLKEKSFLVVCDSLETPGNLGTIYRTLDSVKVDGLICVNEVAKLSNPKLTISARGCNLLIPTVKASFSDANKWLLDNGFDIYLGEPNLGKNYQEYSYSGKIAIVVGSERFGITNKWYDYPHKKVYIPMFGSNNSLNVSVAASILVYEAAMKRMKK